MSTYQRRQEILSRMDTDPHIPRIMTRVFAMYPNKTESLPTGGLTEIVTATLTASEEALEAARVSAPTQTALTTAFSGRLVRAGEPNLNGAQFDAADLEYGLPSLAGGPVTWNHESETGAYGWMESASIAEHPDHGTHIIISGRLWTARFPEFTVALMESIKNNQAAMSMECMAASVKCLHPECETEATDESGACEHILKKTAARRMVSPTFYGSGFILGGVRPGWPGASLVLS